MIRSPAPTLADVAARAGVSTATVSRTLNFPDRVRDVTRERVQTAVSALGYSPHFGARYLASNRTNTVGAIIPTMDNAIFANALQALQEGLTDQGITLLVATSHYDPQIEAEQISALISRGVDGMVLIGQRRPDSAYQLMASRNLPYVALWSHVPGSPHPSVGFDNHRAARLITDRVLALGHRRIGMIAGKTLNNDRAAERVRGVRASLAAVGLSLQPPLYAETEYSFDDAAQTAAPMLRLDPRPTALICGNDVLAAGAMREARSLGLKVPDDLSVVGFDDIDLAQVIVPALTTVRVPHRRMGTAAAELLVRLIREGGLVRQIEYIAEVVERDSLAPPSAA